MAGESNEGSVLAEQHVGRTKGDDSKRLMSELHFANQKTHEAVRGRNLKGAKDPKVPSCKGKKAKGNKG